MDTPKQMIKIGDTLDIRNATKDSVAGAGRIRQVINLIYSPETADLIQHLDIHDVVNRIEAPAEANIHHGRLVIDRSTLDLQVAPLSAIVFGQVTVDRDLCEADIERGVAYLSVVGQMLCPDHLARALRAKLQQIRGPFHIYPHEARLVERGLTLDTQTLYALEDGVKLMVTGRLRATEVVPNDLLARKIKKIWVADGVVCREENANVLLPLLEGRSGAPRVTIIPAEHEMVRRPLVLSANLLQALPSRKLYCTETVRIEPDVDTDMLVGALDRLVVKDTLICPASLSGAISRVVDVLNTEIVFYEGKLWLVQDESLRAAQFAHLEGRATLVVLGSLLIASDVEPKMLIDRLHKVHNYGMIVGTADQLAALQFRLGSGEGELHERRPHAEESEQDAVDTMEGLDIVDLPDIVDLEL